LGQETFNSNPETQSIVQAAADGLVILDEPHDIHNNGHPRLQERYLFRYEALQTDVGQSDGVEHSAAGFDDPFRRVALAGIRGDGLGDKGAERGGP
jgi:hypothetical protein